MEAVSFYARGFLFGGKVADGGGLNGGGWMLG